MRYLPLHKLATALGERKCANILKTHIATGCDWISKLGTKHKALNHEYLLDEFGENSLSDRSVDQAEEYLCLVLKGKEIQLKTFDDYRRNQLIKVGVPIVSLEPSSKCIRNGHIRRMFYLVKTFISLLDMHFVPLDLKLYGWIYLDGYLLPHKFLNPLPQSVTVTCKCKGVCKSCGCQRIARNCTVYCDCNKTVYCDCNKTVYCDCNKTVYCDCYKTVYCDCYKHLCTNC